MTLIMQKAKSQRDLRLDLFRGIAMLIIFIAHVPGNSWNGMIPARFGFSNATEMFVFGSGFASALAFGGIFLRQGMAVGIMRILHRCWQVYWAHIGLSLAVIALYLWANQKWPEIGYLGSQGLAPIMQHPKEALLGLMTLVWQADYLDILPMYLVILALVPVMMSLSQLHRFAPLGVSALIYFVSLNGWLQLNGNPWEPRDWYFNPFSWQFIFFIGFSFGRGWLPALPLRDRRILIPAVAVMAIAAPISFWGTHMLLPALADLHGWLLPADWQQTYLHPLRLLHFFAFAYCVLSLVEPWRKHIGESWTRPLITVGQQSLAVFLASMFLARVGGIVLDQVGRGFGWTSIVNVLGLAAIFAVAWLVSWIKSDPWRKAASQPLANTSVNLSHQPLTPR
jgi:hypothetical protein